MKPPEWNWLYKDPVVRLWRACYGFGRSHYDWNTHAHIQIIKVGMKKILGVEGTMYTLTVDTLIVVITLYVDDVLISGQREIAFHALKLVEGVLPLKDGAGEIERFSHNRVRVIVDQRSYVTSMVAEYMNDIGKTQLREEHSTAYDEEYTGTDHLHEVPSSFQYGGKYVGKLLYLTRCSRPECTFGTQRLSAKVSSWDQLGDKKLERMMCYLNCTSEYVLFFEIYVDELDALEVEGYVDPDHAGDRQDKKGTTGILTALVNQRGTFAAVDWGTKKQGAAAFSTPDAEITALQEATLKSTMPLLSLLEQVTGKKHRGRQLIDNDAARTAVSKGTSLKMKYIRRYQGVSIAGLHHIFFDEENQDGLELERIESAKNLSDGFTKALQKDKLKEMRRAIGV